MLELHVESISALAVTYGNIRSLRISTRIL